MARVLRDGAFTGETHLVTGAAQGIGNAVATMLAEHGAQVVLVDLDEGRLKDAQSEIAKVAAVRPLYARANVADEGDVQRAVAHALEATGVINGVVNVAGITRDARIPKKSFDDFKLVPNGNVGQVDYTAAKGAIESVTKTTAREFSGYRARVNAVAPGPVNTPMLAAVGQPGIEAMSRATLVGRVAEPADIAAVVCMLADPKISGYISGQVIPANGGMYLD